MDKDPAVEGRNTEAPEYQIARQLGEPIDWNITEERAKAPTKQYLQSTLLVALSSGLRELVAQKPENGTEWLGRYLLDYDEKNATEKEMRSMGKSE